MAKNNGFVPYTYGVGLELTASSFKQVKDDLKLNLDNLAKLVKSYGKVLKIDPNADFSTVFAEMQKLKSITDGINKSDNSFAGFVDKGVLERIASLENGLRSLDPASKSAQDGLNQLMSSIQLITNGLKDAGSIKFPATFDNLFGNVADQSVKIKAVQDSIKEVESGIVRLKELWENLGTPSPAKSWNGDQVFDWISRIDDIKTELSSASTIDTKQLTSFVAELETIGLQLGKAIASMSPQQLKSFQLNDEYVISEIDQVIDIVNAKKQELELELTSLNSIQENFKAKQSSSIKSIGVQSEYNAQVHVTPKTNEVEWANKINDTIKNIEPQLSPIKITPTFIHGSKNIQKEIGADSSTLTHNVKVNLNVAVEDQKNFEDRINYIDTLIRSTKEKLAEDAKFKVSFTYEDGGRFRDVVTSLVNQLKNIKVDVKVANQKHFFSAISKLKENAKAKLKDLPATFAVNTQDKFLADVDNLREQVENRIGNIGVSLTLQNMPEFIEKAAMMRDAVESVYANNPVGAITGPISSADDTTGAINSMQELSDTAKQATEEIEKSKSVLQSLLNDKYDSPEFLNLGDINANGKKVRGSTEKLSALLSKYKTLQAKMPDDIGDRWQELYPEANGDIQVARQMAVEVRTELKQVESELNLYYQKQIAYAQSRLSAAEQILQAEKEIASSRVAGTEKSSSSNAIEDNKQLAMSAEEAKKKVKSLNGTLTQQKRALNALNEKGIKSSTFARLGEWDKENGTFKKNSSAIQGLIKRYKELRDARVASGATKVSGEEAKLRGKLSAILRDQKKHIAEIIAKNQEELASVKNIAGEYKQKNKESSKQIVSAQSTQNLDDLIEKLHKAKEAKAILESKGQKALSDTGLGDVNGRLKNSTQSFNDLIQLYNELMAKKREFEKSGDTKSDAYINNANALKGVTDQMSVIYKDQLKYTNASIARLETEIAKEKELLQVKTQQTQEDAKQNQSPAKQKNNSVQSDVVADASQVVKLDGSTLGSLAKDTSLKSIDSKLESILGKLSGGIKIDGYTTSTNERTTSVPNANEAVASSAEHAAKEQHELNNELIMTRDHVDNLSNAVKVVDANTGNVKKETYTYRTPDKVSEQTETSALVKHKGSEPTFEHVSTTYKTNMEAFNKLRQDFINSLAKEQQIEAQIASTSGPTSKLQSELAIQKDITRSLEAQLKTHKSLYTTEVEQAAITEANKKAKQEIAKIAGAQSDKDINKQNADVAKAVDAAQKKLNDMQYAASNFKVPMGDAALSKLKEYESLLATLKTKQQEIAANPSLLQDQSYTNGFNELLSKMKAVQGQFVTLQRSSESFLSRIQSTEDIKPLGDTFDSTNLNSLHNAMLEFANTAGVGTAKLIEFNDAERTATFEIQNGNGYVQQLSVEYDVATNSLGRFVSKTRESQSELQKFFGSLKHSFQNVARYITTFGSVYRIFAIIRRGINDVKDIDSALTELKKVTDETERSYRQFLQTMSSSAAKIGSTVKDLTSSAADWARLGYSMKEAGELAENTAILMNVSEFDNVNEATDSLISSLQAFKKEGQNVGDFSMQIIDKYNEVGNNYAISTADLASSLTRSSAALVAANNSIDEVIAMTAAANTTIQDPDAVGNALKVVSMRIRGVKTELEEAGEDTEGMVATTAKLQSKIMALTNIDGTGGINILTESGEFKSTYEILLAISEVWAKMDDTSQAALLELVAGKTRGSVVAALFQNGDVLKNAYESAALSSGSALEELETHLDSIQGRIELFSNSVQTMWMNFLNSNVIKGVVDLGTGIIKLVDNIGLIPSALAGVLLYFTAIKKNNPVSLFKDLSNQMYNYGVATQSLKSVGSLMGPIGNMSMEKFNAGPVNTYAAIVQGLTPKLQAQALAQAGLNKEQAAAVLAANDVTEANIQQALSETNLVTSKKQVVSVTAEEAAAMWANNQVKLSDAAATWLVDQAEGELTEAKVLEAVATNAITKETGAEIIAKYNLSSANNTVATTTKGVTAAIKGLMASNPIGWILMIVTAVFTLVQQVEQAQQKITDAANEAVKTYSETQKALKENSQTIDDIAGDYEKLAKGVDEFGNNVSLSTSQYERYNEIVNKIADMFPTMIKGYTAEGNAIIKQKGSVEALADAYAALQEKANVEILNNGSNIMKAYRDNTTGGLFAGNVDNIYKLKAARVFGKMLDDIDSVDLAAVIATTTGDKMQTLLKDAGIEAKAFETTKDYYQRAVREFPHIIQGIINSWESQVNAAVSQVKPLVSAYLDTSLGYAGLTSEQKQMVDAIAADFDEEFFNQFNGDASKMYAAIENIILSVQSAGIDGDFSATLDMQTKFNNGDITYAEYKAQIDSFMAILDDLQSRGVLDEDTVLSLKVFFDFQPESNTNKYDAMMNSAKELLLDSDETMAESVLTKSDLEIVDKYKEEWLELEGANITLERLKQLIYEVRKEAGEFSVSNMIDDVNTIQSAFSKLGDAYSDFVDNGIVTADALAEIQETFGDVEGFDEYIAVLGDSSSTTAEVQNAISKLATAYLSTSGILDDLTEENEQFVISQLKAFGVTNAEEYIANMRAVHAAFNEQYGIDLSNYATVEGMKRFISSELYSSLVDIEGDTIDELAKRYGMDLSNFASVEAAKTAIALSEAKKRALMDMNDNLDSANAKAKAERDATTVQAGDIKGNGLFGTGWLAGDKLVGKTYAEVKAEYDAGKYSGKMKSNVESWLNSVEASIDNKLTVQKNQIVDNYNNRIDDLNDAYDKYESIDEYVATYNPQLSVDAGKLGGPGSNNTSSSANEFAETLDWIEIRLEEINEQIDLMDAKLKNASDYAEKNNIIDSIIGYNKTKMSNLTSGIQKYAEYAASLLLGVPEAYRDAAQNGAIAISEFAGEADESTVKAIEKYREWAQKVADLRQELEDTKATIRDLALQQIDSAQETADLMVAVEESQTKKLQSAVDYEEEKGLIASPEYYTAMMENSERTISYLSAARKEMQDQFNDAVESGILDVGSDAWYENINKLYEIDSQIDEAVASLEEFQNAINDIYWDNFDELIKRFDYISDDAQSLIDLMENGDLFTKPEGKTYDGGTVKYWSPEDVQWTDEGLATLGLHAQKLELAEEKAKQYAIAIDDLTEDYEAGRYSEIEYREKLAELTQEQYDAIEAAEDEKKAIVDLNESRIDSIKDGIEKEIDAYEELIKKKQEELNAEKDLYDFQRNTMDQQKQISDIERQLAALAYDTSLSAVAKRKQLEAELAEAQYQLQDTYYNRSVEDKQSALDKELESFKKEKEAETAALDEYLTNVELVVAESLEVVRANASAIGDTLVAKAEEYNLTISDAVLGPWKNGTAAISEYTTAFGDSLSATTKQLDVLRSGWAEVKTAMDEANKAAAEYCAQVEKIHSLGTPSVDDINKENAKYASATKAPEPEPAPAPEQTQTAAPAQTSTPAAPSLTPGSYVEVKSGTKWYANSYGGGSWGYARSGTIKYTNTSGSHAYNIDGLGWVRKEDIVGYAKGTTSLDKSGIVNVDELGDELILSAHQGRLTYLEKGSGIIPADMTSNLMAWGELNPQEMLDRNRPVIAPMKNIVNTEIRIDNSVGEVIHIEHCDQNTLPDVEKVVNKALDKHMQNLNNSLKRFVR